MPKLDEFVAPRPWPAFSRSMSWVNRVLMLHGLPLLRDVPLLNRIPGIRGLTGIRRIVADEGGLKRLRTLVLSGSPTFILPNHPEFFTDWMLDKDIIARAAPDAASWATHGVVNGMGGMMQSFWLWNNLIAQIPGNSEPSKVHSIDWAAKGKGVLLHPEGMVGWHPDWIAPLMPGAADMAKQSAEQTGRTSCLQPVVWKIVFDGNVTAALSREAAYVEKRLALPARPDLTPAQRAHAIYVALADRELQELGLRLVDGMPLDEKLDTIEMVLSINLAEWIGESGAGQDTLLLIGKARKQARQMKTEGRVATAGLKIADRLQKHKRLGRFAFERQVITQEETAAHLKRLRNDWCKGSIRDSINAFLPQPAGQRTAHIRFPEPVEVTPSGDSRQIMESIRQTMQSCLDSMNTELTKGSAIAPENNPFLSR